MTIRVNRAFVTTSGNDNATSATPWIPLDTHASPFAVSFALLGVCAAQWRVQHTFNNVLAGEVARAFTHEDVSAQQTDSDGNYTSPVAAIRLQLVSAAASGRVCAQFMVHQGMPN